MKRIIYIIAIATTILFASCASELDTEPAGNQVSDEQLRELIKKDPDLVLAPMMLGAVNYMHTGNRLAGTNDRGFMIWNLGMDCQGNDLVLTGLTNWFADEYQFQSLRAQTNVLTADRWFCYYKIVYSSNQILDLIPDDATGKALVYKAQAMTYRALAYYYLMCIYQDDYMHGGKDKAGVPLYLSVGGAKGRAPSQEVYSTIISDLEDAIELFVAEGHDPKESVTDIDQTVANMVLARVALTAGEYTKAAGAAGKVIAAGYTLMNETQYTESGFQSTTLPETIWGYTWASATSLGNRSFASFMSLTAIDLGSNAGIYTAIDNRLYDQISGTDYRKKNFLESEKTVGARTYPQYSNTKFDTPDYLQDEVFMRLSEAYLLKAEAEARGGNSTAAQQTLFDLVSKRDTGYAKSTKTGDALLQEIFLQSRIELWGEGHEFFTNKRFNVGVDRMSSTNHTHKVAKPAGKEFTYQIPLTIEISSNPYITAADQNPL
ncbi:RagB/SusD family nutrient uptake outer membrane protein [uncultured Alistipes sp.]|jgi:possible outer membrane protein|uniref:RagB/SusD family nutrient uptake outer membrane protein n=1 Tax=uncultured Alistipes sp. TaxID=538949 RepID=UPI0027D9659F|nr:RagB/SusD family nutrient uptake outer membrane protein [uncultured Alistipes sp.]